jgi:kynurenine formamidase
MSPRLVDLSHTIEDGMPGFKLKNEDGTVTQFTAHVHPFLTHEQSRPYYQGKAEFEITEISFQASIGTYLDSPYHRHRDRRDISQIALDEVILPGVVIDVRGKSAFEAVDLDLARAAADLSGKAVLFNFGWDQHWGTDAYFAYPFLSRGTLEFLIRSGAKLIGVDTLNIDDSHDPERPAHTWLLQRDMLIVENLRGLDPLRGTAFSFFAVPLKVKGAASMPVRAFAQVGS